MPLLCLPNGNNQNPSHVEFEVGKWVQISPPFEVKFGTVFKAQIGGCQ